MRWIPLVALAAVALLAMRPVWRRLRRPSRTASRRLHGTRAPGRSHRARRRFGRSDGARSGPDPFEVLRIQTRLSAVADEVVALERDETAFARAHHLEATQCAYDALLAEACVLAGVATNPRSRVDEQERFREEVELAARGWTW